MASPGREPVVRLQRGWLLVGLIVLISSVILALVGITFFLTEHLRVTSLRQNQTKAIYLAQAGVMQAIYDFRFDADGAGSLDGNYVIAGPYDAIPGDSGAPGLADDDVFVLSGRAGDFLLAAMIPATWASPPPVLSGCGGTKRHRLETWTLRNAGNSSLSFTQMAVSWSPAGSEELMRVDLNGTAKDWLPPASCGSVPSGTTITLDSPPPVLGPGEFWDTNRLWFTTTTMDRKRWIELAFFMSDTSVRRVRFVPGAPNTSSASFTVTSSGGVRSSSFPFVMWRRVQAEYRLNDQDTTVSNLQEPGRIASDTALLLDVASPVNDRRPGYKELTP